jgi:8-oxo-dGTP pyrophosphatase MutT (NUDIX family)
MIWGHDREGVGKVIVAQRGWVNAFTAQDGERVPQRPAPVEMRGPGQVGLPGGKAADPRNLVASAADEALAEAGINVRNGRFVPFEPIVERDSTGHRAHVMFHYQGDIDELAARSDAVVRGGMTADNELSAVRALTPAQAREDMSTLHAAASRQARDSHMAKTDAKRFVGAGQDWHDRPLQALSTLMSGSRPAMSAIERPGSPADGPAGPASSFGPIVAPGTAESPHPAAAAAVSVEPHSPPMPGARRRSDSVVEFRPLPSGQDARRRETAHAASPSTPPRETGK